MFLKDAVRSLPVVTNVSMCESVYTLLTCTAININPCSGIINSTVKCLKTTWLYLYSLVPNKAKFD